MAIHLLKSSFTGGEWSPSLYGRTDMEQYYNACRTLENMIIHPYGGISNRGGTYFIGELSSSKVKLIPFQYSVLQSYMLVFTNNEMRIVRDGGFVVYPNGHANAGSIVVIATSYTDSDIDLIKFTQSADVIYITHPRHPVRKLTRIDHHVWTFSDINWTAKIQSPAGFARTAGAGTKNTYSVTVVSKDGEESLKSNEVSSDNGATFIWNAVADADYYNIYKDENQSGFYGWIGQANNTTFSEPSQGIMNDVEKTPPTYLNPFDGADKYPAVVSFYQQRLVFGRTNKQPQTIWGTVTGSFENMNTSKPARDDDSYNFTLNSNQVNEIRWFVPLDNLLIGTAGGEWKLSSGSKTDAVTPVSVKLSVQSNYGSSHLAPIVIGNTIIFVEGSQKIIRDFLYSIEIDSFTGADVSILAGHLTENNKITSWCYQQYPNSIIWLTRDDGVLLGLTYYRDHKVFGWHKHTTDGKYLSVSSITDNFGENHVYAVIEREINGVKKYYLEQFMKGLDTKDIKNCFYVDSGLTYSGTPTNIVLGLDHLKGKEVVAFADGNVVKNLVVDDTGKIALPFSASIIHAGLPYTAKAETMSFDFPVQDGNTAQDKKKYIHSVLLRLKDTRAVKIGMSETMLTDLPFRTNENYNEPIKLFSGVKETTIENRGENEATLHIVCDEPVPVTLLSLVARVEYT